MDGFHRYTTRKNTIAYRAQCKACKRKYEQEWIAKNSEKAYLKNSQYWHNNKEKRQKQAKAWRKANPERVEFHRKKYRVKVATGNNPEVAEYGMVLLNGPCFYCGKPAETIDHIVPVSAGGANDCTNLAAACKSCNSSKGDKSLFQFLIDRSSLESSVN